MRISKKNCMVSVPFLVLGAEVGSDHLGVVLDVLNHPFGKELSVAQHIYVIADAHDELHVVLNDQDGHAHFQHFMQQRVQILFFRGVHACRRLV
ncbi:hypothetical protein SDC9_190490 [bioreactor metagenome]|uniref:Uncharacterized protein n=1 Tax=bioreactor metagenome TaxID=1076179 RepID=A0A645HWS9_9ZZZZ